MTASFAPAPVRLVLAGSLRPAVRALDAETYGRFRAAWEFSELVLGRSAQALPGEMRFLIPCAGMVLAIRFHPVRELFLIVAFEDFGGEPDPGGRVAPSDAVARLLAVIGLASNLDDARTHEMGIHPKPASPLVQLACASDAARFAVGMGSDPAEGRRSVVRALRLRGWSACLAPSDDDAGPFVQAPSPDP